MAFDAGWDAQRDAFLGNLVVQWYREPRSKGKGAATMWRELLPCFLERYNYPPRLPEDLRGV